MEEKYVRSAPGHKCQRCGADISFRAPSTKWCRACSEELNRTRQRQQRKYTDKLKRRDRVQKQLKICCKYYKDTNKEYTFCPVCGQRLYGMPDEGDGIC